MTPAFQKGADSLVLLIHAKVCDEENDLQQKDQRTTDFMGLRGSASMFKNI